MFTGIIEDKGTIRSVTAGILTLDTALGGIMVGDSIAVNGTCLTVTSIKPLSSGSTLSFDYSPESARLTTLNTLTAGCRVNLERALPANGRFGGHMVSGHVEGTGMIAAVRHERNAVEFTVTAPAELMRYIVPKGSIAIDGISLTVVSCGNGRFTAVIIPHTLSATCLGERRAGDRVNIETDLLAKYVEKLFGREHTGNILTREFLARNGF